MIAQKDCPVCNAEERTAGELRCRRCLAAALDEKDAELRALRAVAEAAARVDDHETVLGNCDADPCIFCDSLRDMKRALDAWRGLR